MSFADPSPKPTNINSPIVNTVRSLCVKVPKGEGEFFRKKLIDMGILDNGLRIGRTDEHVLIPILDLPEGLDLEVCEHDFEERKLSETDYKRAVNLPDELKEQLPTSFDMIGDVGIIRLPDELVPYAKEVGVALRQVYPRLRTVALDRGVKGEFRVRELEVVAGPDELETVHQEYGVRLKVDPSKVYFNPRLANERMRIASSVRPGEVVVDMFAGAGPFAILIAKCSKAEIVFAIDINPDAIWYMMQNVHANKVTNVVPIEGDSRQVIFDIPCSDRIIMNLPHSAREFFADALTRLKFGGVLHLYHICDRGDIESVRDQLVHEALGMGVVVVVERLEELKTYSPTSSVFSFDLRLVRWC
jgi:tRNA (guanine37-N1)-methyltransferase